MGIQVQADLHAIELAPRLPDGWEAASLEALSFGGHTINVSVTPDGLNVAHISGQAPLTITYQAPDGSPRSVVIAVGMSTQL